jgi:hypothetical protein
MNLKEETVADAKFCASRAEEARGGAGLAQEEVGSCRSARDAGFAIDILRSYRRFFSLHFTDLYSQPFASYAGSLLKPDIITRCIVIDLFLSSQC